MKKTILILMTLFILGISFGQDCKAKYTEIDEFSDFNTEYWGSNVSGNVISYGVEYLPSVFFYKDESGKTKIAVGLKFNGRLSKDLAFNDREWFAKGTIFKLRLGSEILSFTVEKSLVYSISYTVVELHSSISIEQIKKIKEQGLEKGRIYPFLEGEGFLFQYTTSKSSLKNFYEQIDCFLAKK